MLLNQLKDNLQRFTTNYEQIGAENSQTICDISNKKWESMIQTNIKDLNVMDFLSNTDLQFQANSSVFTTAILSELYQLQNKANAENM